MNSLSNRRKTRLVDRQFQLGLAWRMLIVFLLFFFAGIVLVFAPSMLGLMTGESLEALEPAAAEFLVLHQRVWPAVLLVLAGIFAYTILVSQRIAGPVYRSNSVLRKMLDGDFPGSVTFRKGDYFQDTAELLDQLSKKLAAEGSGGSSRESAGTRGAEETRGPAGTGNG